MTRCRDDLRDRQAVQIRAEISNAFNQAQFENLGLDASAPVTLRAITATSTNPTLVQMSSKYVF